MSRKYFNILLLFIIMITEVTCKSFTVVIDTTESMDDEINIIKANIGEVVRNLNNKSTVSDYILVPFNDPDVGTALITRTADDFICSLTTLTTSGGKDCPENSLAGIEHALRVSDPESTIYVFTDAYPKNYGNMPSVLDLCTNKYSQVHIILTGVCYMSARNSAGRLDLYYEVARACGGVVLQFESAHNLRQAFSYINELNRNAWNEVIVHDNIRGQNQINFLLNRYSKDAMVVVYGGTVQLQIQDEKGLIVTLDRIIDTRNVQMFRIEPKQGKYCMFIRTHEVVSVTLYIKSDLVFCFGFSPKYPKSLEETSTRPMAGRSNYILISVVDTKIRLVSLEMKCGNMTTVISFEYTTNERYYTSRAFVDPNRLCRITAKGEDENSQGFIGATKLLKPQEQVSNISALKPTVVIIDPEYTLFDFGTDVSLTCKIKGHPEPVVKWEDDDGHLHPSELILLELPSTYISYVTITNITRNTTVFCRAENTEGSSETSLHVYINKTFTFDIVQTPSDITIEYGEEDTVFCEVSAYPEATTKWYHNNSEIVSSQNLQLIPDDNAMVIKNMTLDYTGDYKCVVENVANKKEFDFVINISGLESPQIEINTREIVLRPGDSAELNCRILKGNPAPLITWQHKSADEFASDELPEDSIIVGNKLKILSIKKEHEGIYRCTAVNLKGESSAEVTLKVQFAPVIKDDVIYPQTVPVKEGDNVELPCDVTASPEAVVRWEMSQDDVIIPLDQRHVTDDQNTHRFTALWRDSGHYHCIAENALGTAKKTILVNVLVAPYIETPQSKTLTVRSGSTVKLACNVLYGNPAPSLKWKFINKDSTSRILRNNRTSSLTLNNVNKLNEGSYMCIVDNALGSDRIKYQLKVE
ncbi:hemicentin-1-like [Bombyx mandarina]|uniref:Hemicentin-1-like n=1 Tax=Bombyx mandarina TaxID=7092 RepID=A0A6J2J9F3_BOMMA|nr:hemicentin-1-like [Bombyx mandarina]